MPRSNPPKRIKADPEIWSTPVCDELAVSRWVNLPGEVLASIVELAQQQHDDDNPGLGDDESAEWDGLLAVRLVCSAWKHLLASEFVTAFKIDHTELGLLLKALKLNSELGAGINSLGLVIDCPNALLGPRASASSLPRVAKKVLSELTQLDKLTLDMTGPHWASRPLSHLLGATAAAPLALPATLTKLRVARVHVWLDELEHVFQGCGGLEDLELTNLRGNCVVPLRESALEGRVQLVRVVVRQTTLAAAQLVWLLKHCSPASLHTLVVPLPSFELPNALSELVIDLSLSLANLHLTNRFPPPKPAAPSAATATADETQDSPAPPDPSRFILDLLNRAVNLATFRLELAICPATPDPADGVAHLLAHLPRTVATLVLDESGGSAALRAGILAHLEGAEADDDRDGAGLSKVVTVSTLKKADGPESKGGKQFRARLDEFGVRWEVAGAEGAVGEG